MTPEEYVLVEADRPFRTRRLPRYSGPTEKAIVNAQNELAFRKWHLDREGTDPTSDPLVVAWRQDIHALRAGAILCRFSALPLRDLAKQASRRVCICAARRPRGRASGARSTRGGAGSGLLCRLPMSKVTLIASRRRRRSSPRSKRSMGRVALRRGFT